MVPGGAVAAAGEEGGVRYVWIGIGPGDSTLPVTAAWPLLLRNSLLWFTRLGEGILPPAVRMGDVVSPMVRLPEGTRAVFVEGPAGDRTLVDVEEGTFEFAPACGVEGPLLVRHGDETHPSYLNALFPGESGAVPSEDRGAKGPDRSALRSTKRDWWRWAAGCTRC